MAEVAGGSPHTVKEIRLNLIASTQLERSFNVGGCPRSTRKALPVSRRNGVILWDELEVLVTKSSIGKGIIFVAGQRRQLVE